MSKRTMMMGLAVIAVAGLVGTGTFAAWSDFGTIEGNETAAGQLALELDSTGAINNVGGQAIAPGEFRTIDFFVASADLEGVPSAALSMTVENLVDAENGCSSNSEELEDPDCSTVDDGEFSEYGYVRIRYTDPAPTSDISFGGNSCSSALGGYVNSIGYSPANNNDPTVYPRLDSLTATQALVDLNGDEGICIRIDLGLDVDAPNAVQGDSSTFDLRFDLEQIL
ncbi:MAG TPA: SipW-dependent-type signal peptide-containing protein [Acidimicrobiales bacterium]|nr:SipW-dependent-type signal peptide-containing protein [Acidimicrobiales bacterium]